MMKNQKLKEDLVTPMFVGDNISVNTALQTWTSLYGFFSALEQNNISKENALAIYNSLSQMVAQRVNALSNPAQASMAAVAGPQAAPAVPMTPSTAPVPTAVPAATAVPTTDCSFELEDEEKEEDEDKEPEDEDEQEDAGESPEPNGKGPDTDAEEVKASPEPSEEDADEDKKAKKGDVVDLTVKEDKYTSIFKAKTLTTQRMRELAGLSVKTK